MKKLKNWIVLSAALFVLAGMMSCEMYNEGNDDVLVTEVSVDQSSLSFNNSGDTIQLTATVLPTDATDQTVSWTSDNTDVATVDSSGLVTAVGTGTATITVTTSDGGITASCNITVDLSLEVIGEWDQGWGSILEITENTYSSYYNDSLSYSATIVSFSNKEFNAGDTGMGNCGYMVLRFNNTPYWYDADSITGKYTVFRWQNLETVNDVTTTDYSEGSNDSDYSDTTPGTYYDTAAEAIANVKDANGYFSTFSSMTKN